MRRARDRARPGVAEVKASSESSLVAHCQYIRSCLHGAVATRRAVDRRYGATHPAVAAMFCSAAFAALRFVVLGASAGGGASFFTGEPIARARAW